ncbi:strictosidine synthase [Leptospira perolatii]|uniref:Strictosidine synthase n=1 Tax=Leptospira perolatii TaxID=2023191 RepID=A0A2M9ZRJ2_9LEPT|nr:SMP-30/gluconolactonase/LRE family protein [Leptospira perolatii]PJZ71167.1 strictosidine synthase [Leptospira perolatii]PJZ74700.1 strictosidine synthase [Leptospira perolatii]
MASFQFSLLRSALLRIILTILLVVLLFGSLILSGWTKIDPDWYSTDSPIPQGENQALIFSEAINKTEIDDPFGLAVDSKGWIYSGSSDGNIYRIRTDGSISVFARTSGRPLGLAFDEKGTLFACVSGVGLASYDSDGKETILLQEDSEGNKLRNLYGLDVSKEGIIYFSEVSMKFSFEDSYLEELESKPYGRIFSFDPKNLSLKVLLDQVFYPTGVALSAKEDYLLFGEKYRHRISKLILKGKNVGRDQFFITHLLGSPALIRSDRKGSYWIALSAPRHSMIDKIQMEPLWKKIIGSFPRIFKPKEGELGYILGMNEDGDVTFALTDPGGNRVGRTTSVHEYGNGLLLAGNSTEKIWKWKFESLEIFF